MTNIIAAILTCAMVGGAIAYTESRQWPQSHVYAAYGVGGLFASLFAVSPLYYQWLGIYMNAGAQWALSVICAAGLYGVVSVAKRMVRR